MCKDFVCIGRYGSNHEILEKNISKEEMNDKISSHIKRFREMKYKEY